MSREEAAVAYIDVMLGFKSDYSRFHRAAETLSAEEKETLTGAVFGQKGNGSGSGWGKAVFSALNENDIQNQKIGGARLCEV